MKLNVGFRYWSRYYAIRNEKPSCGLVIKNYARAKLYRSFSHLETTTVEKQTSLHLESFKKMFKTIFGGAKIAAKWALESLDWTKN
jgi:hypothetical protein